MAIVSKELRVLQIDHICDRCDDGQYRPTGVAYASFPPQYLHKCNNCGDKRSFGETFPVIRYAEAGTDTSIDQ